MGGSGFDNSPTLRTFRLHGLRDVETGIARSRRLIGIGLRRIRVRDLGSIVASGLGGGGVAVLDAAFRRCSRRGAWAGLAAGLTIPGCI